MVTKQAVKKQEPAVKDAALAVIQSKFEKIKELYSTQMSVEDAERIRDLSYTASRDLQKLINAGECEQEAIRPLHTLYTIAGIIMREEEAGAELKEMIAVEGTASIKKFGEFLSSQEISASAEAIEIPTGIKGKFDEIERLHSTGVSQGNARQLADLAVTLSRSLVNLKQDSKKGEASVKAGVVGHELLNPVNRIYSAAQRLAHPKELSAEESKKYEEVISSSVKEFKMLFDYLEGREKPRELRMSEVFESVREHFSQGFEVQGGDFEINAGPVAMYCVFKNLFKNAREAGAENILVVLHDPFVFVKNDGEPVPEGAQGALFKPFFTAGKAGGTGLGLALASDEMAKANGTITLLFSNDVLGTAFALGFAGEKTDKKELARLYSEAVQESLEELTGVPRQ